MKKITSTFAGTAVITTAIVGALALCAWFGYIAFKTYLETPHTYGTTQVTPFGHNMEGPLTHSWDSLQIESDGKKVTLRNVDFDLTLLNGDRGLTLASSEVDVSMEKSQKTDSAGPPLNSISFPEKAKFYLPVKADVGKLNVNSGDKHWEAQDISLRSQGLQGAKFKADSIKGDFVVHTAALDAAVDFQGNQVSVDASIKTGEDSLAVNVKAPKENLTAVKTDVELDVKNPEEWIPAKLPPSVQLGSLKVKAEAKLDPKTHKPTYKTTIKTHIGEFWPLLPIEATVKLSGDDENFHTEVHIRNDEGGTIDLSGDFDKNLNGMASGKVSRMSAMFGPQMMPMDMTIHSAEKIGNKMNVVVETRQGSVIDCDMDFENGFRLTYFGDMSPFEPWALDWNMGELELKERFRIYGSFEDGHMKALVKIDTIPYAWHMTADSLQIFLDLDKHGINFSNGIIYTPKETFDVTGDVVWDRKMAPHTSWQVTQRHGGKADAYISILDSTAIKVKSDSVEVSTIPFAKIHLSDNLRGRVTGNWVQNFNTKVGALDASIEGSVEPFNLQGEIVARENGDTIFIDKAKALHSKNMVQGEAVFILPNDSNPDFKPTSMLPIQVVHSWASAKDFSIPLLLEPLGDTTFTSGIVNGDISYNEGHGLQGNVDFLSIEFKKIPSQLFNVKRMNMFAEADKMELNAYLGIGGGGWTGNTQIIVDDVFNSKRHVSVSHISDNGGDMFAEGFIDSLLTFNGQLKMKGSWFIPGTLSEVKNTDVTVDVTAKLKDGLKGIVADIRSDSTLYQPPKLNYQFPFQFRGHLENSILDMTEIKTQNDSGETVSGTMKYNLDSLRLMAIDIQSDRYSLYKGPHKIVAENISGHMEEDEDNIIISGNIGNIHYNFFDDALGEGEAIGHGDLNLIIPHSHDGILEDKTITGNVAVDKLVYHRDLDIEVTPSTLDKFLTLFNNAISKLRSSDVEAKISTASPINLAIHVSDSQNDSIEVVTPFATFPLTFDIWVLGNTNRPLLRGDITNSNTGFIGVQEIYEFDLNSFRISWNDVPWQHGVVDVSSSQELPYCDEDEENEKETCPVNLDFQGTITNLQPNPSSNCGNESSAASIYYNIFLGCIASQDNESTDWNKLAGKAIGKVISSTANKTLGGEYIGDIDMKVMLFENTTTNEKDSSYFKLPISLDRWVKDLSLIFGYTQDQSENPTYDQSLQFGINYTLPVFKGKEYSHRNHLSPSMSLYAQMVSKQYLTNTGTEGNENRVEKNIGINYVYRYWNPCLLGIGHCETISNPEYREDQPKPPFKKTETRK